MVTSSEVALLKNEVDKLTTALAALQAEVRSIKDALGINDK